MAEHGGRRDPGSRQAASGPGKFSTRTDGQKIHTPDLDHPEVQSGDVGMITDAQRAVPVPSAGSPVAPGGGVVAAPAALPPLAELRGESGLAPFVTEMPTGRPDESLMAGSDVGPGPGSEILQNPPTANDDFEALLEYFSRNYGDLDATETLAAMRGGSAGQPGVAPAVPLAALSAPVEEDPTDGLEGLDATGDFTDMDFEEDLGPAEVPEDQAIEDAPVDEGGEPAPADAPAAAPAPEPVEA